MRAASSLGIFGITATALVMQGGDGNARMQELHRHRNLGKAFYENPTTQRMAVAEFRKVLELLPGSTRERVNYGLALLRAGQTDAAVKELKLAQQQDPRVPHT